METEVRLFKPKYRERKEARELGIFKEYQELMSVKGQSKTEVIYYLMDKYDVGSTATIYNIIKRTQERYFKEAAV